MEKDFDIIIVGSGLSGLLLSCLLKDLNVCIIERHSVVALKTTEIDHRTTALAYRTKEILSNVIDWSCLNAGSIKKILVADADSSCYLDFLPNEIGYDELGFVVENNILKNTLLKQSKATIIDNDEIDNIETDIGFIKASLKSGMNIKAKLLVASDGASSSIARGANFKTYKADYNQKSIVFNIKHSNKHNNTAVEKFTASGPFAILPLYNDYMSNIIWTERADLADYLINSNRAELTYFLNKRIDGLLEDVEITSPISSYNLKLNFTSEYAKNRICLMGNSLHTIHPIAGQGFNLIARDIDCFANIVLKAKHLGLDIGSDICLQQFKRRRLFDNYKTIFAMDGLNRLFSNNYIPVKMFRRMGLYSVNKIPRLKNMLALSAMGV